MKINRSRLSETRRRRNTARRHDSYTPLVSNCLQGDGFEHALHFQYPPILPLLSSKRNKHLLSLVSPVASSIPVPAFRHSRLASESLSLSLPLPLSLSLSLSLYLSIYLSISVLFSWTLSTSKPCDLVRLKPYFRSISQLTLYVCLDTLRFTQ